MGQVTSKHILEHLALERVSIKNFIGSLPDALNLWRSSLSMMVLTTLTGKTANYWTQDSQPRIICAETVTWNWALFFFFFKCLSFPITWVQDGSNTNMDKECISLCRCQTTAWAHRKLYRSQGTVLDMVSQRLTLFNDVLVHKKETIS